MDAMETGAKELDEVIRKRESEVGDILQGVKDKAYDAQNEFFTAQAKLENAQKEYEKMKK